MTDTFASLVERDASAEDIAAHLDGLEATKRVEEVLAFPGRLETKLWPKLEGRSKLEIDAFVGATEQTIIYELKNSLPMFSISQKRFFKPAQGEVFGYNHTGGLAKTFAGPGYFFARDGDNGELVFDYTRLPTLRPEGWPEIVPNKGLLRGVTYGDMIDYVRQVSKWTVLGTAYKKGKPLDAYFLLTRSASQS